MIVLDDGAIERIAESFDLREPNRNALCAVVQALAAGPRGAEYVVDIATGVGKTYLMAALIDYLADQGVRNVLIITPGRVVQNKTVANFDESSRRHIGGAESEPVVVTPATYRSQRAEITDESRLKVYVFNIHQLLSSREGANLGTRKLQEQLGTSLYGHLQNLEDLYVIADEHHIYHQTARSFSAAIRELDSAALIGLTATPSPSDRDKLVFEYTLGEAIADKYVKRPMIVYRPNGTPSEALQLLDAVDILRLKEAAYLVESEKRGRSVHPCLFVVASSIDHADEVGRFLASDRALNDGNAVLTVTSGSSEEDLQRLEDVGMVGSPVRAIVSVNKLREGWDVSNIAVLVALRKLASQALTEQVMGRGLRLPFGERTGVSLVDSLDIIAHDSYKTLLAQKDLLAQRTMRESIALMVDDQGYAEAPQSLGDESSLVALGTESVSGSAADERGPDAPDWDAAELDLPAEGAEIVLVSAGSEPIVMAASVAARSEVEPVHAVFCAPARRIVFPLPDAIPQVTPFELVAIPTQSIRVAGERHRATTELDEVARTEVTSVRVSSGTKIGTRTEQNLQVTHKDVADRESVARSLRDAVVAAASEVPRTAETLTRVAKIVEEFLKHAGPPEHWTQPWLERARQGIVQLIRGQMAEHRKGLQWQVTLTQLTVPSRSVRVLGNERNAHDGNFIPGRHESITGWNKHLLPVANFDAVSTEWAIASILDTAPAIERWLRLDPADGVIVRGAPGFVSYYPDFIAVDSEGIHWLIEGKSDVDAQSASVQAKKATADAWARRASDSTLFGDEWRYLFATESAIRASGGTWPGLKASSEVGGS